MIENDEEKDLCLHSFNVSYNTVVYRAFLETFARF